MNLLVALAAGYQGLPAACSHPFDPEWSLLLYWFVQVCKFTDVVDFAGARCPAKPACLSKKALDDLASCPKDFFGMFVEDRFPAPSEFDAAKSCYQGGLAIASFLSDFEHLVCAMGR